MWEPTGAGEAKLEAKVVETRALGRQSIEVLIWDKDRLGKEYLGELNLGLHDWWGPRPNWDHNQPPLGFTDPDNHVSSSYSGSTQLNSHETAC